MSDQGKQELLQMWDRADALDREHFLIVLADEVEGDLPPHIAERVAEARRRIAEQS